MRQYTLLLFLLCTLAMRAQSFTLYANKVEYQEIASGESSVNYTDMKIEVTWVKSKELGYVSITNLSREDAGTVTYLVREYDFTNTDHLIFAGKIVSGSTNSAVAHLHFISRDDSIVKFIVEYKNIKLIYTKV